MFYIVHPTLREYDLQWLYLKVTPMNDMSWDYLYHIQAVENHCFHHCHTFVEQRYNLKYYSNVQLKYSTVAATARVVVQNYSNGVKY